MQEEGAQVGGLISYQRPSTDTEQSAQLFVPFTDADLKQRGMRFTRGDMVEFVLGSDPKSGRQTASQVNSLWNCSPPGSHSPLHVAKRIVQACDARAPLRHS